MLKVTLIRPIGCAHYGQVKGTVEKLKKITLILDNGSPAKNNKTI